MTPELTQLLLNAGVVGAFALYQILGWQQADKRRAQDEKERIDEWKAREDRQREDKLLMLESIRRYTEQMSTLAETQRAMMEILRAGMQTLEKSLGSRDEGKQ